MELREAINSSDTNNGDYLALSSPAACGDFEDLITRGDDKENCFHSALRPNETSINARGDCVDSALYLAVIGDLCTSVSNV